MLPLFESQNKHSEVKVCGRASSLVHQKTILQPSKLPMYLWNVFSTALTG